MRDGGATAENEWNNNFRTNLDDLAKICWGQPKKKLNQWKKFLEFFEWCLNIIVVYDNIEITWK
jgi:hypothetical protein